MVLAALDAVEEMPVVGGLLEGGRHEVILCLPLGAVVGQLLEILVHCRQFAVRAGARNLVDDEGAEDEGTGEVDGRGLSQAVSS